MRHTSSYLRLLVLALLWGSSFLFIKVALNALSAPQIAFTRIVLGALVLLALCALRGHDLRADRSLWSRVTVAALFASALPWVLIGIVEQTIDSGLAGVLNATTPLWTVLFGLLIGQERLRPSRATGLLLGFSGVVLILAPWHSASLLQWGALACLTASASYGIAYVYIGRKLTGHGKPPVALAALQMSAAAGLAALALPIGWTQVQFSPLPLLAVGALGVFGTGAAFALNYRLIADEGATTAATVTYLAPVVSVLLGWLVLGEALNWRILLGVLVVLTGVALIRQPDDAPARRTRPHRPNRIRGYTELLTNHPMK